MQFRYSLTEADFALARQASCRYLQKMARTGWVPRFLPAVISFCVVFGILSSIGLLSEHGPVVAREYGYALAFAVAAVCLTWLFVLLSRRNQLSLHNDLSGPFPIEHAVELSPSQIRFESEYGTAVIPLSAIRSVEVLDRHVALILRPASAILIPLEAIGDQSRRDEFIRTVRPGVVA